MVAPIIGALATGIGGGLASKVFGGNKTATTAPWGPAAGRLEDVLNRTQDSFESGTLAPPVYRGNRVAGFSPQTEAALGALGRGSGLAAPSISNLTSIMDDGGMYRDFDRIRSNVADRTKAELASVFAGGGINSSLAQDTYTRAMGDALANVEYGAYNDAQNRRLSALGLAPSISAMQGAEEKAALGAGVMRDDLAQRRIDADMDRFNEGQDQDYEALRRYASIAMGAGGMGGTATTPTSFWNETLPGMGKFASGIGGLIEANNANPNQGGGGFWSSVFGG